MDTLDNPSYFSLPCSLIRPEVRTKRKSEPAATLPRNIMGSSSSSYTPSSSSHVDTGRTLPRTLSYSPSSLVNDKPNSRRSFRNLLRSLSGPSVHVRDQHLQMLGIAPPIPVEVSETDFSNTDMLYYNTPSSLGAKSATKSVKNHESASKAIKNHESASKTVKNHESASKSVKNLDGASRSLKIHESASISVISDERVSKNDEIPPRYHNITEGSRRRHSIGAFFRERPVIGSTFARVDVNANVSGKFCVERRLSADRWLHQQAARRRCARAALGQGTSRVQEGSSSPMRSVTSPGSEMDDILIVSYQQSQVANVWVNYIKSCFDQICKQRNRPPFRVLCKGVEEMTGSLSLALEERLVRVKLQLVVICPQFLQHISEQPATASHCLANLLQPKRVLALLLGVEEASVTELHKTALVSYPQWKKMPVRNQDETFVEEFLNEAMSILAKITLEIQEARQDKALFSVVPKKVKHGHNKLIVLLNEPLTKDDKVKVIINKNGEMLEVTSVKKRNPFTLHFAMPDVCLAISMLVGVSVEKNGEILGSRQVKCESKMRELDSLLRSSDSPVDFMCKTLGLSGDREQLDHFLVSAFQRNLPQHFNLLRVTSHELAAKPGTCGEELPTLLHFAARYGLEKLAWQLLECPGGDQACDVRNVADLAPADIAEKWGHLKLSAALKGYMQMNEFTNMYCYLKMAAEGKATSKPASVSGGVEMRDEVDYHRPRPPSETYQVPPLPRPVTLVTPEDSGGYLEMFPSKSGRKSPVPLVSPTSNSSLRRGSRRDVTDVPGLSTESYNQHFRGLPALPATSRTADNGANAAAGVNGRGHEDETHKLHSVNGGRVTSREHLASGSVQDELVEIISDFKNNVFTISEVEKLVESWRNRNDVQQSFKEKQDQLREMREEYDRLQQKMKSEMKRATPFDRIKSFFKSSKSKEVAPNDSRSEEIGAASMVTSERVSDFVQRPASSLSVHSVCSSSSSERMSTMSVLSGCSNASMGDSGTHSDPEEHKGLPPLRESPGTLMPNYAVPPSPKPVHGARPKFTRNVTAGPMSLDVRPPMPTPRPTYEEDGDNYIQPGEYNGEIFDNQSGDPDTPDYMNLAPPTEGRLPNYLNLTPDTMQFNSPPIPPRR